MMTVDEEVGLVDEGLVESGYSSHVDGESIYRHSSPAGDSSDLGLLGRWGFVWEGRN